ncbi:uncharacterized protein LOC124685105 isoform X3 [Lolium rigidum]|uniref:uncharacterized protein LOC124685105 isoform X3 n=1 Tax=Lolium rigidum TaxID=89674 RepID=UPI001F5D5BD6|nr:uncharacterized protein LOC124685105 isoform X3 [Lolium rigidum]
MNHSKIFSEGNIGCIMRGIFSNIINTLGMCVFFEDIRCIYSHPYSGSVGDVNCVLESVECTVHSDCRFRLWLKQKRITSSC